MGLSSKCEIFSQKVQRKTILLAVAGVLAAMAFFAPPEVCKIYEDLCKAWRYLKHFDKLFHFLIFAGFVFCIPCKDRWIGQVKIILLLIVLGMAIEGVQYFIPHRGASLHDLYADVLGIACGVFIKFRGGRKK